MKKLIMPLFLLIFICNPIFAKPLDLYDIQQSTVQINADKQQGTGTCIAEDEQYYYILSNAHVILNQFNRPASKITINSFRAGYKSSDIPAELVKYVFVDRTVQDISFLRVSKSYYKQYPLRVIPIAPDGYIVQPKHFIYSSGCPYKSSAMSWVGHIVEVKTWIEFSPFPQPGQSGSAIFGLVKDKNNDELYTRVIGIVTWTKGEKDNIGGAIPIQCYYDLLEKKIKPTHYYDRVPVSFQRAADYAINTEKETKEDVQNRIFPLPRPFNGQLEDQLRQLPQQIKPENPVFPNAPFNQQGQNSQPNDLYGSELPNIGGVWPGTESKPKPDVNTNIESLPTNSKPVVAEKQSWFSYLRDQGFGWLQALGLAGVIGILATVWKFRLRSKTVEKIDKVQDHLQDWVSKKINPEFASEFREGLEAIETMILGVADSMLQNQKVARMNTIQEQLSKMKGLVDIKQMPTEVDVQNLLAAVRAAAADPNEPNVSAEVAKKVEELVAKSAK